MSASVGIASYAFLLAARLVGIFILPAQVPGDPVGLIEDLFTAPLATVRGWPSALVRQLLLQLVRLEKFTLPEDSQLVRLHTMRQRYLAAGWEATSVTTPDAVVLDALLRPPPAALAEPRFVLFVGGNFQKYEDWLPYFDAYARAAGVGFLAFNFRGVGRSEGAVCCAADMLTDVHACIDALLARGVRPAHLCVPASRSAAPSRRSRSRRASSPASPSSATARSARCRTRSTAWCEGCRRRARWRRRRRAPTTTAAAPTTARAS